APVRHERAWQADGRVVMDLPIHIDPVVVTIRRATPDEPTEQILELDDPLEDSLGVISDASARWVGARTPIRVTAREGERTLHGILMTSVGGVLYRVTAPGTPRQAPRALLILQTAGEGDAAWARLL